MPTYVTMAPNLDITAEVSDVPDSRHARTAFLDYLTRNRIIPYTMRKVVRGVIMTKRVDPGEVPVTVRLSYRSSVPQAEPVPEEVPTPVQPQSQVPGSQQYRDYEEQPQGSGFESSPIYRMSRSIGG